MTGNKRTITFAYRGSFPDGEVFDDHENASMPIVVGRGEDMRALEDDLAELEIRQEHTVELAAKDAYGEYDPGAIQHVPTFKIPNGANMPVGQYIGWTSPRNIEPIPVKVVEIVNQVATLYFNHPLAGKDIVYWVKVIDIAE